MFHNVIKINLGTYYHFSLFTATLKVHYVVFGKKFEPENIFMD